MNYNLSTLPLLNKKYRIHLYIALVYQYIRIGETKRKRERSGGWGKIVNMFVYVFKRKKDTLWLVPTDEPGNLRVVV